MTSSTREDAVPDASGPSPVESDREETLRRLEREMSVLIRRIRKVIGERARAVHESLQPASYIMLAFVQDEGPLRASRMVETFDIDKGAISRQVQHLIELGLIDSEPDPADRRASLLSISAAGRERMAEVVLQRRAWLNERLAEFDDAELSQFVDGLGHYNTALSVE